MFKNKIIVSIASLWGILGFAGVALANPYYFVPTTQTSTATSSPTYMYIGATTTLAYDTYNNGNTSKTDFGVLLVQLAGSSTASVLNMTAEYSQDGVDWYKDKVNSLLATTSPVTVQLAATNSYTWTFASSTVGGANVNSASGGTTTGAILVSTPLRWWRMVFTVPNGSTNLALWAQFVPIKQRP